jgi:hypothetical protein
VVSDDSIHRDQTHDLIPVLVEKVTLERFGKIVRDHFFGRAVLYRDFFAGDVEGNGVHTTQVSNQDTAVLLHYP